MKTGYELKKLSEFRCGLTFISCFICLIISDITAWFVAYQIIEPLSKINAAKFSIIAASWCGWMALIRKHYSRRQSFWVELGDVVRAITGLAIIGSMLKAIIGNVQSLYAWLIVCLLMIVLIPLLRWLARFLLQKYGLWSLPTLVFGGLDNAMQAVLALRGDSTMGYETIAMIIPRDAEVGEDLTSLNLPMSNWPKTSEDFDVFKGYHCVIALEANEYNLRDKLIRQLSHYKIMHVHVIPAMRGVPLYGLATSSFFSHEVLMIHIKNRLSRSSLRVLKRGFDIVVSLILLLFLSPLFAYLAYRVSKDGGRPFFAHERIGQAGKSFACYKFRSMVVNADEVLNDLLEKDENARAEWQKDFKLKKDPRINPIGHLLRRTSLDELPQLWNVLRGEMSLVGPRPVVASEIAKYGDDATYYLMVKPGMTGLWQISGRNDVDYETRVYFDSWYVKNWTFLMDLTILFKTIEVVFGKKGAY
jgi:UDP-galactose-lipid carrier transferase